MAEVDRLMVDVYSIDLIKMMENAGRHLARLAADRFLGGAPAGRTVIVLAGARGNGGGALAAARRLHAWGAQVRAILSQPRRAFEGAPARQLHSLLALGVEARHHTPGDELGSCDLVIDGLVGYRLSGPPRHSVSRLVEWANAQPAPVLALDIPTGVDASSGQAFPPAIRASATLTLALPKAGLLTETARPHVGELYLADIGVPPALYARPGLGLNVGPLFAASDLLRLD
jgi:NAD(P)H-hydrate epimerase